MTLAASDPERASALDRARCHLTAALCRLDSVASGHPEALAGAADHLEQARAIVEPLRDGRERAE